MLMKLCRINIPLAPFIRGKKNSKLITPKAMNKKEIIQKIIHFVITILTAIATTLGTTSCIGMMG